MEIGVLALQGDFAKHGEMLTRLGVRWREVRAASDLAGIDGLIIPGGESSTMLRLMRDEGLFQPLTRYVRAHPTFGTCAGAIMLARTVKNPAQESLNAIDIEVERNSYGRQINSFSTEVDVPSLGPQPLEMVFIRAPGITNIGSSVIVLARCQERPVLVCQGSCLAATFHPELTNDKRVHELFINMVKQAREAKASALPGNQ